MAGGLVLRADTACSRGGRAITESAWTRRFLILAALGFLTLFLILPLLLVFVYAFGEGLGAYFRAFTEPDARAAITLTLITAAIAVPVNTGIGIAAAWSIAKFDFRGKQICDSGSPWPALSPSSRVCSCWMNRSAPWTPKSERNCEPGCAACTTNCT